MLEIDSAAVFDAQSSSTGARKRRASRGCARLTDARIPREIQPFPSWARLRTPPVGGPNAAADAAFVAGASLARLDQILRCSGADLSCAGKDSGDVSSVGKSGGGGGDQPVFAGALRQRLALKAAAACVRLARLREDAAALRDAEHLSGAGMETSPAGRVHRLWRLFASRAVKFDAATLSLAIEYLEAQDVVDVRELADALRDVMASADNPLAAAASASAAAGPYLTNLPAIDAEIFALWLADVALGQKLGWQAPMPLLSTVIAHPALRRGPNGRRPRPGDQDWSVTLASAYALAAGETMDLAGALSRQTQKLLDAAPKLRAKGAARVIEMLLQDDCVSPARAAKAARLSDRASRRLFDRLVALGAVRELTGRANFRLYGL